MPICACNQLVALHSPYSIAAGHTVLELVRLPDGAGGSSAAAAIAIDELADHHQQQQCAQKLTLQ